jgi:hypothetical protein
MKKTKSKTVSAEGGYDSHPTAKAVGFPVALYRKGEVVCAALTCIMDRFAEIFKMHRFCCSIRQGGGK